jgi:hypothetical protein
MTYANQCVFVTAKIRQSPLMNGQTARRSHARLRMQACALLRKISSEKSILPVEISKRGGKRRGRGVATAKVASDHDCTRSCMRVSPVGGRCARPRLPLPLRRGSGGARDAPIGRGPVHEVVPALIILNKSSPLRRLIIEFAVP